MTAHPADCPTCACDPTPMPYDEARRYTEAAIRAKLPTGPRTAAALVAELDRRDGAYVKLGKAHANVLGELGGAELERDAAILARDGALAELDHARNDLRAANSLVGDQANHLATAEDARAELACRVDELVAERDEARTDRQTLAAENGAYRDERDNLILERDRALAEAFRLRTALNGAEALAAERDRDPHARPGYSDGGS